MSKKRYTKLKDFAKELEFSAEEWKELNTRLKLKITVRKLRESRKKLGLTQAQLAKKAGLPRTTVTKIETGALNTSLIKLMQLAEAMDMHVKVQFTPIKPVSKTM